MILSPDFPAVLGGPPPRPSSWSDPSGCCGLRRTPSGQRSKGERKTGHRVSHTLCPCPHGATPDPRPGPGPPRGSGSLPEPSGTPCASDQHCGLLSRISGRHGLPAGAREQARRGSAAHLVLFFPWIGAALAPQLMGARGRSTGPDSRGTPAAPPARCSRFGRSRWSNLSPAGLT
ncbi:hypothetical protein NDU88_003997 [Pleurodeles waltl]|uniref:Uncharacterized protein n=1 Tax=Pleurodeles waltl TaxID=8319 RepID=A0AAV7SHJ6_PLEWA|nr:hypothetical protein NDU88_003997 [Pleurodeles waltl]